MRLTITFDVDEGTYNEIQRLGYNSEDYINAILIRELKKERSNRSLKWLEKNRLEGKGKPAEQLIREDRDKR